MRLISRLLPKSKNPELAKTYAVFTALFLIFLSYFVALGLAFGLPIILSKILPDTASKDIELYVSIALGVVVTAFFVWMSWDTVDAMVGTAIKADAEDTKQRLEKKLEQYKAENAEKEYVKRQNLEFVSVVLKDLSNEPIEGTEKYSDESLRQAFRRRIARDAILRELAYNDVLLKKIALEATKMALRKTDIDGERASRDTILILFRHDLYIYLKAWLMHSISNGREMNAAIIKQRCLGKQVQYINALTHIKQELIRKHQVSEKFEPEHRADVIQMLEEYLDKLIASLQQAYRKIDTR